MSTAGLDALAASVARLRALVEPLDAAGLGAQAYPSEWTVADVVSHLGSGAVIMRAGLDAQLGASAPIDNQSVWDEWNAKSPQAKAADGLAVDRALVDRLMAVSDADRAKFSFSMGPMTLDFDRFVGMRLNEHALHTWDVAVTFDADAVVAPDATAVVVDNLSLIARFAGKAIGPRRDVHVRTVAPARDFTLSLGGDAVALEVCADAHEPDIELPAEAFIRLVYGRLDPDRTPLSLRSTVDMAELRAAFPGI